MSLIREAEFSLMESLLDGINSESKANVDTYGLYQWNVWILGMHDA